jgi:twitching motility protein PilT
MQIKQILATAIQQNASDLHLSSGLKPLLRIDGDLQYLEDMEIVNHDMLLANLQELLPATRYHELVEKLEIDLSIEIPNLTARFRVNAFFQSRGISAVFRVIPTKIATLQELGMPTTLQKLTRLSHGLVLVTGPTGSGKSTTLAAMLNYINNNQNSHIVTIEDPIEFIHISQNSLMQQREVHQHTRSFANALRAVLREDPDVILIGEMRDLETIRLALTAAETGHLVFATLHTNSAAATINRIVDVFPAAEKDMLRTMLAESLQAVLSQQLYKKINGGRIAALEIMLCNAAVRNLIRENKIAQIVSVMQTSKAMGMQTLADSMHDLITRGLIAAPENSVP